MQPHETLFTPTEAAVLTGLPLKAVNNAIDRKTVVAIPSEEGARLLDARALVSLSIERRLSASIATPELRRKVFDALAEAPRKTVSLEGRPHQDRSTRAAPRTCGILAGSAPGPSSCR
jgi:hypothetical protein